MAKVLTLTGRNLTIEQVEGASRGMLRVVLSPAALKRARRSKRLLDNEAKKRIIYGVNTGFGPMASRLVGSDDLAVLQRNLVRSHACGAGEPVPEEYALAAMVIRLNTLLRGDSGVSAPLLERLRDFINLQLVPVIPEHGGVGASGDLIQLSHIALALIGEGEVFYKGVRTDTKSALTRARVLPYTLEPKEGLALINGTSFMSAVACLNAAQAHRLFSAGLRASALALEAAAAFDDSIEKALHMMRPHPGQKAAAHILRKLTKNSTLLRSRSEFERSHSIEEDVREIPGRTQDVYSLRCAAQILGPMLETFSHTCRTLTVEINATTDNPLIDSRTGRVLHGGNFHGEYVAVAMDSLKVALTKLSMLSERRLNFFLHDKLSGLAPFLNKGTPGLTLGLQGLQFTATSTTAHNQSLSYPHALHSIPSNGDNQDVVSMGADAALLTARVARNTSIVLAAEQIALSQAFSLTCLESGASPEARSLLQSIRRIARPVEEDRPLYKELDLLAAAILAKTPLIDISL